MHKDKHSLLHATNMEWTFCIISSLFSLLFLFFFFFLFCCSYAFFICFVFFQFFFSFLFLFLFSFFYLLLCKMVACKISKQFFHFCSLASIISGSICTHAHSHTHIHAHPHTHIHVCTLTLFSINEMLYKLSLFMKFKELFVQTSSFCQYFHYIITKIITSL